MGDYQVFKAKVKGELKLRRMKYAELAELCGYSLGSIRQFMQDKPAPRYDYSKVASAIATALNLEM